MLTTDLPLVAEWVSNRAEADPRGVTAAIGWVSDGRLVAGATYEDYTGGSITATIAIENTTMVRQFLRAIFEYPFRQLNVGKIFAMVAQTNSPSRRLVEKMGFVQETVLKDYYSCEDLIVYSMTAKQCRFLGDGNGQEHQDPESA
jgi:RimJ/RimL family protein N-acetyltransferase